MQVNDLGEVTGATILKGRYREIVKRHVNSLILLLSPVKVGTSVASSPGPIEDDDFSKMKVANLSSPRTAALRCLKKIHLWLNLT